MEQRIDAPERDCDFSGYDVATNYELGELRNYGNSALIITTQLRLQYTSWNWCDKDNNPNASQALTGRTIEFAVTVILSL
jgi:hypothetical protein